MSRISSMARHEKGLVVRGTGYVSPLQPSTSCANHLASRNTVIRRAGSVGCLSSAANGKSARSGATARPTRAPFLPAGRGGAKPTRWRVNSAAAAGNTTGCSNDSASTLCKCQHPADIAFLEDLYVQNLQTQIEVLEMENTYLRSAGSASALQRTAGTQSRTTRPIALKSILVRADVDTPVEVPESPPALPTNSRASLARKRVEFVDTTAASTSADADVDSRTNVQANGSARHTAPMSTHDDVHTRQRLYEDEDLFERLERAIQNEVALDEKLNANALEIRKLRAARASADAKFRSAEAEWTTERRSLLEDNVELQLRLDELTPLLAEKEARLARLEDELERSVARVRQAETRATSFQARLEDQKREGSLLSELDSDRRLELDRLRDRLRKLEADLIEARRSETAVKSELAKRDQALSDRESALAEERTFGQRLTAEKTALSEQLAKLAQRVQKLEADASESERAVQEARRAEADVRAELRALDERHRQRGDSYRELKARLRDQAAAEDTHRQARHRMTKELEALRALSQSLTEENRGLREERIAVDERVLVLQNKVFAKERDVIDLTERLDEFKRKYNDAIERLSDEIARQHDTSEELEAIVKRVHELSTFIPHRSELMSGRNETAMSSASPSAIVVEFPRGSGADASDASEMTLSGKLWPAAPARRCLSQLKQRRGEQRAEKDGAFSIDSAVDSAKTANVSSSYQVALTRRRASYRGSPSSDSSARDSPKAAAETSPQSEQLTPTVLLTPPPRSGSGPAEPPRDDSLAQRYRKKIS